jgi:uncharacterized protein
MSKKALITWGGWDGHEPEQTSNIMADALREEGYDIEMTDSLEILEDEEHLKTKDLIIPCWTMSEIKGPQFKGLRKAVLSGVGIAGWHGGMGDSFRVNTEFQFIVGGQFICHPGGIIDYTVNLKDTNDPITEGLSDFQMHSEQYYMHIDPSNEVLATTTFTGEHTEWVDGCVMPTIWKRVYGEGKVFYSALGHNAADFEVPEAKEIMKRGCIWATR